MLRSFAVVGQALLVDAQTTPGFEFLGYGYDVLYGNPMSTAGTGDPGWRTDVFTFTYKEGKKTQDGKWTVPDKTTSQDFFECSDEQDETIMYSAFDYQQNVETGFSLSGGYQDLEASLSVDFRHIERQTLEKRSVFAHVQTTCSAYHLTMHTYDHPPLDDDFAFGVKYLPTTYDEQKYMEFIVNFGTHVATQLTAGGRWGWQMNFKNISYHNLLDNDVDIKANIKYAGQAKAGFGFNHSDHTKNYYEVVNSISSNSTFNVGGTFSTDMKEWMAAVKASPMPIHLQLMPLDYFISSLYFPDMSQEDLTAKSAAMKNALKLYCKWIQINTDPTVTCTPPQPIDPPKPDPVPDNAVRQICVKNSGGFRMWFEVNDLTTKFPVKVASSGFNEGSTECLAVPVESADRLDAVRCTCYKELGATLECTGQDLVYDVRARRQANYICDGSTFTGSCYFHSFTDYGVNQTVWV